MESIKEGTIIYKYCSANDLLLNFDNNTVVLTKASLFNDPFDSNIIIPDKIQKDTINNCSFFENK